MENYGKIVIKIAAILTLIIFLSNIVLLPALVIFGPIVLPVAKAMELVANTVQGIQRFFTRHFSIGTGRQNTLEADSSNESYSYVWDMGTYSKIATFGAFMKLLFFRGQPARATTIPLGNPIPLANIVYGFLDDNFKPGVSYYDEIDRQMSVLDNGQITPNNRDVPSVNDENDESLNDTNQSDAETSKDWRSQVTQVNYMNGMLYNSDAFAKFGPYEDKKEEANWESKKDSNDPADKFYKQLEERWKKAEKDYTDWLKGQYITLSPEEAAFLGTDKVYYIDVAHVRYAETQFELNASWVYTPIEGWDLKKYGLDKEKVYPAIGVKEGSFFFSKDGYHIYEGGKVISKDTFDHYYTGIVLTGLRTNGSENIELEKQKEPDKLLKEYYDLTDEEIGKLTPLDKKKYLDAISYYDTADSYLLKIEAKPFSKSKLKFWLNDLRNIGLVPYYEENYILDLVDSDGFYSMLGEKGDGGLPNGNGRIYTEYNGDLFKNYNFFHPVQSGSGNHQTPLFIAETSHPSSAMTHYYFVGKYQVPIVSSYPIYGDPSNPTEVTGTGYKIDWTDQERKVFLDQKDHVWGPNPTNSPEESTTQIDWSLDGLEYCFGSSATYNWEEAGNKNVSVTVQDIKTGDAASATLPVTVNQGFKPHFISNINVIGPNVIKTGDTATYTVQVLSPSYPVQAVWGVSGGLVAISPIEGNTFTVKANSDGLIFVMLSDDTDNSGIQVVLSVKAGNATSSPFTYNVGASGSTYVDVGKETTFSAILPSSLFSNLHYFWDVDGNKTKDKDLVFKKSAEGTYKIELVAFTSNGNVATADFSASSVFYVNVGKFGATSIGSVSASSSNGKLRITLSGPKLTYTGVSTEYSVDVENDNVSEEAKLAYAHENHGYTQFPIYYKIEIFGQGVYNVQDDGIQKEDWVNQEIIANLISGKTFESTKDYFSTIPIDPLTFFSNAVTFTGYNEGTDKNAPTKIVYPPVDISGGIPFGNPTTSGCITSPFGWRADPISGEQEFHLGIDIGIAEGTPVHSAMDGTVYYAGWLGGYGFIVIVQSKVDYMFYVSKYAHLSQTSVSTGDTVTRGQQIGVSGSTGYSTGPHLHYEVHAGTTLSEALDSSSAQNPEQWGASYSHCP